MSSADNGDRDPGALQASSSVASESGASELAAAYVLGNDRVYDWLIAFVKSFRLWNPTFPLYLIRFDDQCARAVDLVLAHGGKLYDSPEIAWADRVCLPVAEGRRAPKGKYRRLALLFDASPIALYFDADLVITHSLDEFARRFADHPAVLATADVTPGYAYRDEAIRREMIETYSSREFCSGAMALKPGNVIDRATCEALIAEVAPRRTETLRTNDQALLNWLVDRSGVGSVSFADVWPEVAAVHIPGRRRRLSAREDGCIVVSSEPDQGRRVICCHWAGGRINSRMPCASLYLRHRLSEATLSERLRFVSRFYMDGVRQGAARLPGKIARSISKRLS